MVWNIKRMHVLRAIWGQMCAGSRPNRILGWFKVASWQLAFPTVVSVRSARCVLKEKTSS